MFVIAGWDASGRRSSVRVEWCWRCGLPVNVDLVSMTEHVDQLHPVPGSAPVEPARHRLRDPG